MRTYIQTRTVWITCYNQWKIVLKIHLHLSISFRIVHFILTTNLCVLVSVIYLLAFYFRKQWTCVLMLCSAVICTLVFLKHFFFLLNLLSLSPSYPVSSASIMQYTGKLIHVLKIFSLVINIFYEIKIMIYKISSYILHIKFHQSI